MKPIEWLENNAPGFRALEVEERDVFMHFSLLWSYFEAVVLDTYASANAIIKVTSEWKKSGQLYEPIFAQNLDYFRARYITDGRPNHHFDGLRLHKNDHPTLLISVLTGESTAVDQCAYAALIIVYRYRNNYLHGQKWAYELKDQLNNFMHANQVLISALNICLGLTQDRGSNAAVMPVLPEIREERD